MFRTTPNIIQKATMDVPPFEMNGRVIPVFGIKLSDTAIFTKDCIT